MCPPELEQGRWRRWRCLWAALLQHLDQPGRWLRSDGMRTCRHGPEGKLWMDTTWSPWADETITSKRDKDINGHNQSDCLTYQKVFEDFWVHYELWVAAIYYFPTINILPSAVCQLKYVQIWVVFHLHFLKTEVMLSLIREITVIIFCLCKQKTMINMYFELHSVLHVCYICGISLVFVVSYCKN